MQRIVSLSMAECSNIEMPLSDAGRVFYGEDRVICSDKRSPRQLLADIKGVIFDLDGTLVESSLNFAQIRQDIGCPEGHDLLEFVDAIVCNQQRTQASLKIQQHELADAAQARWLPGAKQLVEHLCFRTIPQAIVTRNFQQAAAMKVERNRIPIERIVTREDAPPKPDPSGLIAIANEWQIAVSDILYVGDFLYDIQAAQRAGMVSCLYAPAAIPDYAKHADMICHDFDLLTAAFAV
ncbi:HAD family hydrolase [Corallincola spongiicola]|nr:HAD family hydrolase [Corallincola spongiicola]